MARIAVVLAIIGGLASLVGVGLGIAGVVQENKNKTGAALGLVFSGLTLVTILVIIVVAAANS